MTYQQFIYYLKKNQTDNVKPLYIPESCSVNQIPQAFATLLHDIVSLIQNQLDLFCAQNQWVALFGFQVASGFIQSSLPKLFKRIHYPEQPDCHFCCVLYYRTLTPKEYINRKQFPRCSAGTAEKIESWGAYKTIVVDFTTGTVMDVEHYLGLITQTHDKGKIYGSLDARRLQAAWEKAAREERYLCV
jgi:hypothetical protein